MASDDHGWPATQGEPENPERDGWHWMLYLPGPNIPIVVEWLNGEWQQPDPEADPGDWGADWRYLGPCLLPEEVAAQVAAARRAGIEEIAEMGWGEFTSWSGAEVCDRVRALLTEPGA